MVSAAMLSSSCKSRRAPLWARGAWVAAILTTFWLWWWWWGLKPLHHTSPSSQMQLQGSGVFRSCADHDFPLPWGGRYAPQTRARLGLPPLNFLDGTSVERHRPQPRFPDNLHKQGALGQRARDYRSAWIRGTDVLFEHGQQHQLLLPAGIRTGHPRPGPLGRALRADAVAGRGRRPTRVVMVASEVMGLGISGGIGTEIIETTRALLESPWPFHVTVLYSLDCDQEGLNIRKEIASLEEELGRQHFNFVCLREAHEWKIWKPRIRPDDVDYWAMMEAQVVYFWLRAHEGSVDVVHAADYGGLTGVAIQARRLGIAFDKIIFITYLHGRREWALIASGQPPVSKPELFEAVTTRWAVEGADIVQALNVHMGEAVLRRGFQVKAPLMLAAPNVFSSRSEGALRGRKDVGSVGSAEHRNDRDPMAAPIKREVCREIVFFGRLESRKGWQTILGALSELSQRYAAGTQRSPGHSIVVTFIGRKLGHEPDIIRELWNSAGIHKYFDLRLETAMARDVYLAYLKQRGRVVVVPSRTENMPFTVIEALLAGAHLLAANVGGIPELIDHIDTGALVASTVRGWTEALGRCMEDGLGQRPHLSFNMDDARLATVLLHARAAALVAEQDNGRLLGFARLVEAKSPKPDDVVTVCIASHNRADTLDATLGSLAQQTFTRVEVIVFDDASSSAQRAKIGETFEKWQLSPSGRRLLAWRLIDAPGGQNVWLGTARRHCAAQSSQHSVWLMFMDDDDMLEPQYIETMLRAVHSYPADMASTPHAMFEGLDSEGNLITTVEQARASILYLWTFLGTSGLLPSTSGDNSLGGANIFIRKATYWRLGGHSEMQDVIGEDYGLWVRAATFGVEGVIIPEPLYLRRIGGASRMSFELAGEQAQALGSGDNMEMLVHSMAGLMDSGALGPLSMLPFVMSRWYGLWRKKDTPKEECPAASSCEQQSQGGGKRASWGVFPGDGWDVGLTESPHLSLRIAQAGMALKSGAARGMVWQSKQNRWRRPGGVPSLPEKALRPFVSPDGRLHPAVVKTTMDTDGPSDEIMAPYFLWKGTSSDDKPNKRLQLTVSTTGESCGNGVLVMILANTRSPDEFEAAAAAHADPDGMDSISTDIMAQFLVNNRRKELSTDVDVGGTAGGRVLVMIDPQGDDFCDSVRISLGFV